MIARVVPMPAAELEEWSAAREAERMALPQVDGDVGLEALRVMVDDVVVGGTVVTYDEQGSRPRASLRLVQTTLPPDANEAWCAVLGALEAHVRSRGATVLVTAVPPELATAYQAAGFKATMTTVSKRLDPDESPELQEDRRVSVRPMTVEERRVFATEVGTFLRSGMERAGVLAGENASLGELGERLERLAEEPGPGELLVMGLVDGEPVGRAWATLVTADDGSVDFLGNTIDLFPQFRGQGLTRSFLGALVRYVREVGVRDIHLRVYAHDDRPRRTFLDNGAGIADVHLRKDLT